MPSFENDHEALSTPEQVQHIAGLLEVIDEFGAIDIKVDSPELKKRFADFVLVGDVGNRRSWVVASLDEYSANRHEYEKLGLTSVDSQGAKFTYTVQADYYGSSTDSSSSFENVGAITIIRRMPSTQLPYDVESWLEYLIYQGPGGAGFINAEDLFATNILDLNELGRAQYEEKMQRWFTEASTRDAEAFANGEPLPSERMTSYLEMFMSESEGQPGGSNRYVGKGWLGRLFHPTEEEETEMREEAKRVVYNTVEARLDGEGLVSLAEASELIDLLLVAKSKSAN